MLKPPTRQFRCYRRLDDWQISKFRSPGWPFQDHCGDPTVAPSGHHGGDHPAIFSGGVLVELPWKKKGFILPSGKHHHNYGNHGKSPFVMGKFTINGPFSIAMLVYQRVTSCKTGMIILQKYPKLVISLGQIGISLAVT